MKASLSASLLESLLESARMLNASLQLDHLLKHLLRTVMGRRMISKGVVALAEDGAMRVALARGMSKLSVGREFDEEQAREAGVEELHAIEADGEKVGLLGLGSGLREVDEAEEAFLEALLGIAASGIRNAKSHVETQRLNEDLNRKVQDLRTLLELTQSLTATLEPEEVARHLTLTLSGHYGVSRYAVGAWKEGHPPILRQRGMKLPPREEIGDALKKVPQGVFVRDLPNERLASFLSDQDAEVLFPLRSGETPLGLAVLGPRLGGLAYEPADLEFGAGLVGQAVVAFENGWHFTETVEKRRMEQELGVAAGIQQDLFPSSLPEVEGYELAAHSRPARQVGGDYYDVLPLDPAEPGKALLLCVADISGKGVPASLLMANIQATLRALLSTRMPLVELVARTSKLLYNTTPANKYATAILVGLDPASGKAVCVNAGHNDGLLLDAEDGRENWASTGPPVGLIPNLPFEEKRFELKPGGLLALYSDGVVEARNAEEEEFGEERFLKVLREHREASCDEILKHVYQALDNFAGDHPQHDDITLMLVRRALRG